MIIQDDPVMLNYVNAKLQENVGSFLSSFFDACLRADGENYQIIRPALVQLSEKYPADPLRLKMEWQDTNATLRESK
jgi:hypothetical protein